MRRKFVYMALLFGIALTSWSYWTKLNVQLNIRNFNVLKRKNDIIKDVSLRPPNSTCKTHQFLVLIVTSYVGHVELRSAHRRAMTAEELRKMRAVRVFLLAQIPEKEKNVTQLAIKNESDTFGDILQGSFIEDYRNLTYKHLMGLQWASTTCKAASFILKVDDDTVFHLENTYALLQNMNHTTDLIMGYLFNNTKPLRDKKTKWYVTLEEYPRTKYPPYLSGSYYITTPTIAAKLCDEAIYHPFFWIDDVFVSGLLTESLDIKLRKLPDKSWLDHYEMLECCLDDILKTSIKCHFVGPNGGNSNLIVEYSDAINNCNKLSNCTKMSNENLKKICYI